MPPNRSTETDLTATQLERRIYELRDHNVMLDHDLADLYRVDVRVLNQAVARNGDRFPPDFMFRLTHGEVARLTSQTQSSPGRGGRRYLPFAFTEEGVALLSSVLGAAARLGGTCEGHRISTRRRGLSLLS